MSELSPENFQPPIPEQLPPELFPPQFIPVNEAEPELPPPYLPLEPFLSPDPQFGPVDIEPRDSRTILQPSDTPNFDDIVGDALGARNPFTLDELTRAEAQRQIRDALAQANAEQTSRIGVRNFLARAVRTQIDRLRGRNDSQAPAPDTQPDPFDVGDDSALNNNFDFDFDLNEPEPLPIPGVEVRRPTLGRRIAAAIRRGVTGPPNPFAATIRAARQAAVRENRERAARFRDNLEDVLVGIESDDVRALIQSATPSRAVTLLDRTLARRYPGFTQLRIVVGEQNTILKGRLVQAATALLPAGSRASLRDRYLRNAANKAARLNALEALTEPQPDGGQTPAPARPPLPPRPRGQEVRQYSNAAAVAEAARRVLTRQLDRTPLKAIVETLQGDPARRERVERTLRRAGRTVLNAAGVEGQRPLQPWEREYLATVAPLTTVNPYVLTTGKEAPAVTQACMDAHYDRLITDTRERLPSGSYARVAFIGFGEHATIAAGELMRIRPDLFDDPDIQPNGQPSAVGVVFVDRQRRPSGTFGYPGGRAFRMNSGVPVGDEWFAVPEEAYNQPDMVRAYGGMFRGYPGERPIGENSFRPWSINRGIDWMPPVDAYVDEKYPYNDQKALSTEVQASLVCRHFLGESEFAEIYVNRNGSIQGEFLIILNEVNADGSLSQRRLYTDNPIFATGKNKARSAFENTGGFRSVLAAQQTKPGLPYYTTTLAAYRYLSDETKDGPIEHGGVFILTGDGNSVDTQLEALGREVAVGNLDPTKIKKIYVVGPNATTKVACRPRYQAIRDLFNRPGRPNVVELIDDRLQYLAPTRTQDTPPDRLQLAVYTQNGDRLVDPQTNEEIVADHVIDSIGFRLDLEDGLRPLLQTDGFQTLEDALEDITIPGTNLAVGQRLISRPNVMFIGTAAAPGFTPERLADLPPQSAEVLRLVGPENAVAIGFVGGNTQASVFINARQGLRLPLFNPDEVGQAQPQTEVLPTNIVIPRGKGINVGINVTPAELPPVRRNVPLDSVTLTSLLMSSMPEKAIDMPDKKQYRVRVTMTDDGYAMKAMQAVPASVMTMVGESLANPYFRAYAEAAAAARRTGKRDLEIVVGFKNGRVVSSASYAEAM